MNNFKERIEFVLQGRKLIPWSKSLELSKGTAERIMEGQIPDPEILSLIMKIENVSVTWLLEGIGRPFLRTSQFTSGGYARYLKEWLERGGKQAYVITDKNETAIILVQPAEHEYKGKCIPYSAIKVTRGDIGDEEKNIINCYPEIYLKQVNKEEFEQVKNGELGSFKLLGDQNNAGLLTHSVSIDALKMSDVREVQKVKDSRRSHTSNRVDLLSRYDQLNDHNKESVSRIIDVLLGQQRGG